MQVCSPQDNNFRISLLVTRIHSLRGNRLLLDLKVMTILAGELDTTHVIFRDQVYAQLHWLVLLALQACLN